MKNQKNKTILLSFSLFFMLVSCQAVHAQEVYSFEKAQSILTGSRYNLNELILKKDLGSIKQDIFSRSAKEIVRYAGLKANDTTLENIGAYLWLDSRIGNFAYSPKDPISSNDFLYNFQNKGILKYSIDSFKAKLPESDAKIVNIDSTYLTSDQNLEFFRQSISTSVYELPQDKESATIALLYRKWFRTRKNQNIAGEEDFKNQFNQYIQKKGTIEVTFNEIETQYPDIPLSESTKILKEMEVVKNFQSTLGETTDLSGLPENIDKDIVRANIAVYLWKSARALGQAVTQELLETLTPTIGQVSVTSSPVDNAVVTIAGKSQTSRTNNCVVILKVGTYDISVKANGYKKLNDKVTLLPNKVVPFSATLIKE